MKYIRDQIDKMRTPNDSTKAVAKLQSCALENCGQYPWLAMERRGKIQFRRVTPVSTAIVTIEVIEV